MPASSEDQSGVDAFHEMAERFARGHRDPAPEGKQDWIKARFPIDEMSPEEWAAHEGANVHVFGLHRYVYPDAKVDAWIVRLGSILKDPEQLRRCQEQYLAEAELGELG